MKLILLVVPLINGGIPPRQGNFTGIAFNSFQCKTQDSEKGYYITKIYPWIIR